MIISSDPAQYYNFIFIFLHYVCKINSNNFVRIATIQKVRICVK